MAISRKRKKNSHSTSGQFNINHFLKCQLRKLPIECCYVVNGWETAGVTSVVIIRKSINDKFSAA